MCEWVESALILEKRYFRCMFACRFGWLVVLFTFSHWIHFLCCVSQECGCDSWHFIVFIKRLPMIVMMLMMVECMRCPLVMRHLPMNWHVLRPMVIESHVTMMMTMPTILWIDEYVNCYWLSLCCCHCCCCCPHRQRHHHRHFHRLVMGRHVDHHCHRNNRQNLQIEPAK